LAIHIYDIYRNPNVGIFSKASEGFLVLPIAYSAPKSEKLASLLGVGLVHGSVGGTRLLGPLMVMNSNGMLLSRFAEDQEVGAYRKTTGLRVERLDCPFTSVGNLIAANDKGGVVAPVFSSSEVRQIQDVLGVPVDRGTVAGYYQLGSVVAVTNLGALTHPRATEDEISWLKDALKVDCEVSSINGGVPFVASGVIANSRAAIVGTSTTGPELFILGKAFKV
jgi:translation initiation factor 6